MLTDLLARHGSLVATVKRASPVVEVGCCIFLWKRKQTHKRKVPDTYYHSKQTTLEGIFNIINSFIEDVKIRSKISLNMFLSWAENAVCVLMPLDSAVP